MKKKKIIFIVDLSYLLIIRDKYKDNHTSVYQLVTIIQLDRIEKKKTSLCNKHNKVDLE
jgi:hypothetical protein